jgi:hypothetical protein
MPPPADTSFGKKAGNALDDVVQRLNRLEELVRAVTGDLRDVKAQQTVLDVSLIRLEQQVPRAGDGTSGLHVSPDDQTSPTGNSLVAPPPAGGHGRQQDPGQRRRVRRRHDQHIPQDQIPQV